MISRIQLYRNHGSLAFQRGGVSCHSDISFDGFERKLNFQNANVADDFHFPAKPLSVQRPNDVTSEHLNRVNAVRNYSVDDARFFVWCRVWFLDLAHCCIPRILTGSCYGGEQFRKYAPQQISYLRQFARVLSRSANARGLAPFLNSIRERVARKVSSSPGFFENLQRGRIKSVPAWLMRKLRDALISELQGEVQKLQHEIHLARQTGEGPDSDAIFAAATRLAEAKKILGAS